MEADERVEPFAVYLLKEHQKGKTVEVLSRETGIPVERIEMRLRAANLYLNRASAGRDDAAKRKRT